MKEYICKEDIRNKLYDADAITMRGVAIINDFPAADVRPVVRGKWKEVDRAPFFKGMEEHSTYRCSSCHAYQFYDVFDDGTARYNFCPNCGADMREESWTQILCKKCGGKRFIERDDIVVCDKCGAKMEES